MKRELDIKKYVDIIERILLIATIIVLIILAIVSLGDSFVSLFQYIKNGSISSSIIDILSKVILVIMILEIIKTISISIKSHSLTAEPFLIIGIIAAIRRMIVITAESTELETTDLSAFKAFLMELGLLGFLAITLALSILILRKSNTLIQDKNDQ